MPQPRKSLICLSETPYYHCVSRCVRRAFLCGVDHYSGRSYEHRRKWVENRLLKLASIFCIDICAYAIMHNHSHIVLHVDKAAALKLTTAEVLQRWHTMHKGTLLTRKFMCKNKRKNMMPGELDSVHSIANIYRARLYDISWFMRLLNEFIARMANKEDECTGRFWEGRFKSQALLDEAALLACMTYVDLNPVRASIATQPIDALFTSGRRRLLAAKHQQQPRQLMRFTGPRTSKSRVGLPFNVHDYLRLLHDTSLRIRTNSKAPPTTTRSSILVKAGLDTNLWEDWVSHIETAFASRVSLEIARRKLVS